MWQKQPLPTSTRLWASACDASSPVRASTLTGFDSPSVCLLVLSSFERNLDVWRQLWRVCEASEILLVLLDVRCPMLHFPPSLQEYLRTLKPRKKCILVLTKTDLVPEALAREWKAHLEDRFGYDVVLVESYREHAKGDNAQGGYSRADEAGAHNAMSSAADWRIFTSAARN